MSFLTGQDRTPKFAGQVLLDQSESPLIFLNILPNKKTRNKIEKKFEKKFKLFFPFDLFSIFISLGSGKENVQFPDSPDFDILSDMMSSRPLEQIPHFPRMFHRACLPYGSGKANLFFIKPGSRVKQVFIGHL